MSRAVGHVRSGIRVPGYLRGPEGVLTIALLLMVVLLPLGEDGRAGMGWGMNAIAAGALVLSREVISLRKGAQPGMPLRRLALPAALIVVVLGWGILQTIPVPAFVGNPAWGLAADALDMDLPTLISVDPESSRMATLRLATLACGFWVAVHLAADARRAVAMLSVVVAVAAALSLHGLFFAAAGDVPTDAPPDLERAVRLAGLMGNRNTFATYAGMGLIVGLALLWHRYRQADMGDRSFRGLVTLLAARSSGTGAALIGAVVVLAVALMVTGSRGGIISTLVALVVLACLMIVPGRDRFAWPRAIGVLAFFALAGTITVAAFGDLFAARITSVGVWDEGRLFAGRVTLNALMASPWVGYGHGSFPAVFPMFRDDPSGLWTRWGSAHNTYLEVLLDFGVPVGLTLLGCVATIALACLRGVFVRSRYKAIPAAAFATACLVAIHAAVDYTLWAQSVGLTFAIILGIGFAQAERPHKSGRTVGRTGRGVLGKGGRNTDRGQDGSP